MYPISDDQADIVGITKVKRRTIRARAATMSANQSETSGAEKEKRGRKISGSKTDEEMPSAKARSNARTTNAGGPKVPAALEVPVISGAAQKMSVASMGRSACIEPLMATPPGAAGAAAKLWAKPLMTATPKLWAEPLMIVMPSSPMPKLWAEPLITVMPSSPPLMAATGRPKLQRWQQGGARSDSTESRAYNISTPK